MGRKVCSNALIIFLFCTSAWAGSNVDGNLFIIAGTVGIGSTSASSYVNPVSPHTTDFFTEGNIGIGSIYPGQRLDVQGTTSFLRMQSPNGTQWKCKPTNAGAFTCT